MTGFAPQAPHNDLLSGLLQRYSVGAKHLGEPAPFVESMTGGFTGPDLRSAMRHVLAVLVHVVWSREKDRARAIMASSLG